MQAFHHLAISALEIGAVRWARHARLLLMAIAVASLAHAMPLAAQADLALRPARDGTFQVPLYKSGVVPLQRAAGRISVGNAGIADILILRNEQLYVVGRALGTTNVVVWDKGDRIVDTFDIEVTHDLESLKLKLHQLLPGEDLRVHSAQGKIILSGGVSNIVKMNAARQLAAGFLPECAGMSPAAPTPPGDLGMQAQTAAPGGAQPGGAQPAGGESECGAQNIINMMQIAGAQQVMLEIKVAEIARDILKRFESNTNLLHFGDKFNIDAVSGGASFPDALFGTDALEIPVFGGDAANNLVGPSIAEIQRNAPTIDATGLALSYLSGEFLFEAILDLSRRKGLGKILAEPTLTTITGQEAEFLSGGEFPIPVPRGIGTGVTIEFKEFGVGVKFLPVVLDSGRISLKLNVGVSELSRDNAVFLNVEGSRSTFTIPSLTKRTTGSSVELADGQTIGVAGLLNESTREFVDKLPGLGDLPVLGQLFRSQEYRSGLTELVMFVTPHLAKPIAAHQARLPTDSFVPPDDLEFYLLGRMEGREPTQGGPAPATPLSGSAAPAASQPSSFGHEL